MAAISRHSERAADLSSSLELVDAPVVLGLCEHGLDHRLAFSVEPTAEVAGEHAAHEGVAAAIPAAAGSVALARVGRDQHLGAVAHDVIDLILMPVAAVSNRDPGRLGHTDLLQFPSGGLDHRLEVTEVW